MSPEPQKPNRDEWRDRLVDRALEERLGGDVPPDLTAKILAAAVAAGSSTGDVTMATATAKRSWGVRNWVLAASVLVNVGLIAVLLASRTQPFYTMAANEAANENRSATESAPAGFDNQETPSTSSSGPAPAVKSASESSANGSQVTTDAYEVSPDDVSRRVTREGQETSQFEWSAQDRSGGGEQAEGQQGQGQAAPLADELSSLDLRAKTESKVNLNATPGGGRGSSGQNQATDGGAAVVDDMGLAEFGGRGVPSRQNGLESFYEVELGAAPVEGAPVVYPDKQTWDQLTRSRAAGAETAPREEALDAADPSSLRFGRAASERGRGDGSEDAVVSVRRQLTEKRQYTRIAGTYSYDYGADRATWGYAGTNWREWPPGEAVQWQGRPDGEGIGPGAAGDQYERIHENRFIPAIGEEAVSTFSIDVDTASYANVRQMLMNGQVPPPDAVRLEEMVNYFDYNYEPSQCF